MAASKPEAWLVRADRRAFQSVGETGNPWRWTGHDIRPKSLLIGSHKIHNESTGTTKEDRFSIVNGSLGERKHHCTDLSILMQAQ